MILYQLINDMVKTIVKSEQKLGYIESFPVFSLEDLSFSANQDVQIGKFKLEIIETKQDNLQIHIMRLQEGLSSIKDTIQEHDRMKVSLKFVHPLRIKFCNKEKLFKAEGQIIGMLERGVLYAD